VLKKIFTVILLISLFASVVRAGEEYMADVDFEPKDFRGIKWQEKLENLKDMEELYRDEDESGSQITCSRKNENLLFGRVQVQLDSIEYIFVNGKLSMISAVTKGERNQKDLLDEAKSLFGHETVRAGDDYMWRFSNVMVMYSKEPDEQSVLFYKHMGFINR
jgi:hypothetical protein